MSLPLPWSFSKDDPAGPDLEDRLQEQFDKIAVSFPDLGGAALRIRAGSGTLTWAASTLSGTAVVNHGLGATPTVVIGSVEIGPGFIGGNPVTFSPIQASYTTTQFSCQGRAPVNLTGSTAFYWLAIA